MVDVLTGMYRCQHASEAQAQNWTSQQVPHDLPHGRVLLHYQIETQYNLRGHNSTIKSSDQIAPDFSLELAVS